MSQKKNLGRGLNALLGDTNLSVLSNEQVERIQIVPIEKVRPGTFQPRKTFPEETINELAESIREKGLLQPILVRRGAEEPESFEIIAGERRWRAAQKAQLHLIPAIIKAFNNQEALEVGLMENLQREDLSPIDQARSLEKLVTEFKLKQEDIAKTLGRSRSYVSNTLRLLGLPKPIVDMLEDGRLSAGHARALLGADKKLLVAEEILRKGLNVRQTEKIVSVQKNTMNLEKKQKDINTVSLEQSLSNSLGLRVVISENKKGGSLTIHYLTIEQLDNVLAKLK
ncbi:MAG: Chromosome-partitioning protein ParB [Alphaproteobacteria bacterium MarineAlpha3_Bin5]|nr:chromosome partitioning protein ParB [Magnetovibrio sp.]PPR80183.1 MAG: Chromosome-partitioning protein ParB [Alphaproteobacteria bacterium MarineAlpha3_Bin5]|tara:strand:- start:421 stop:1269 length:849 start_codon:yes stop_codon:yes gene_type:complete